MPHSREKPFQHVIMQRVCDHASCNADILRQHSGETNATDATIVCPRKCIDAFSRADDLIMHFKTYSDEE